MHSVLQPDRKVRTRPAGFTLVEVMIGVFVFAVVMLAVFNLFSHSVETAGRSIDLNRVNQALQFQMESLRGKKFADFKAEAGTQEFIGLDSQGRPAGNSGTPFGWLAFKLTQDVSSVAGKADHYEVALTAEWTDSHGRERVRQYRSWFSKDGLNDYYTRSTTE